MLDRTYCGVFILFYFIFFMPKILVEQHQVHHPNLKLLAQGNMGQQQQSGWQWHQHQSSGGSSSVLAASGTGSAAAAKSVEPAALWSRANSSALPAAVKRNHKQEGVDYIQQMNLYNMNIIP